MSIALMMRSCALYFPLSTGSDSMGSEGAYYHMFGALSSASIISNVVFEIEVWPPTLSRVTEAYSEFLSLPVRLTNHKRGRATNIWAK